MVFWDGVLAFHRGRRFSNCINRLSLKMSNWYLSEKVLMLQFCFMMFFCVYFECCLNFFLFSCGCDQVQIESLSERVLNYQRASINICPYRA